MSMNYKYFAFISYNSKDTAWGKRLQRKLEHYRMPSTLCSERGWEKRTPINPVFFAPTDIQPGGLSSELQERLRASRHLIVICSPNSAQSEWVGREIAFFHSLGRTKNIHFFIVDGTPHSNNPQTECFNSIVKELGLPEILGANIHEKVYRRPWLNRERAYVQLISKLLDIEFDAIWQRHRRLLRQKLALWAIGIVAVIATLFGVWFNSQPVDVTIRLKEVSTHNPDLPPLANAIVTMSIENETKTDTIISAEDCTFFTNIPNRCLGKPVHVTVSCRDYLPIDTTFVLTDNVLLNIHRDVSVYGNIRFQLWNPNTEKGVANISLKVGKYSVTTDAEGFVSLQIPLAEQKSSYPIVAPILLGEGSNIIHMPCGERVIVSLPFIK